jgi:hypothetical protein
MQHGTPHTYRYYKCRCTPCIYAIREYNLGRYYARKTLLKLVNGRLVQPWLPPDGPWKHGMYTTYYGWSCRCEPCSEAGAAATRRYRETGSYA